MKTFEELAGKVVYAAFLALMLWKPAMYGYRSAVGWHERNYVPRPVVQPDYLGRKTLSDSGYNSFGSSLGLDPNREFDANLGGSRAPGSLAKRLLDEAGAK